MYIIVSGPGGSDYISNGSCLGVCLFVHYTVVEECKLMLVGAGFTELKERDTWKIEPGNKVWDIHHTSDTYNSIVHCSS